ncbi:type II toxin-antitoxin system RelE/ParE family toxin [Candidatus Thiosymbion oneisti]|uniref:type II toxin-antitoxin system RelE/ParE family toxin n=1 Tax=Candidatus Thiosymbion oneisti TaxID=589554 RepID=UPI000A66EE34|nr:type II toxin-antitoxin system RelE/ParE family toxin [Candidatus Thiosymbion oneisti]
MGLSVNWSPEATEDLESIAEYIGRDSEFYARVVVFKILATSRQISEHPNIGRKVPEINDEKIRERFVYSYRLIYKIGKNQITIVAVIHGKRLFDNVSDRFEQQST